MQAGSISVLLALAGFIGAFIDARFEIGSLNDKVSTLQASNRSLTTSNNGLSARVLSMEHRLVLTTQVVTWAFQQCRVSAGEIQRIDPTFALANGPRVVATAIVNPSNGAHVPAAIDPEGKLCGSLPSGSEIWIAIVVPGIDGFYPQGASRDHVGPVTIRSDSTWVSSSVFVGAPQDQGHQFAIVAILANPKASTSLWSYLRRSAQTGHFKAIPLPAGAQELARVTVTRQ